MKVITYRSAKDMYYISSGEKARNEQYDKHRDEVETGIITIAKDKNSECAIQFFPSNQKVSKSENVIYIYTDDENTVTRLYDDLSKSGYSIRSFINDIGNSIERTDNNFTQCDYFLINWYEH